jgi:hypothetical protein
MRTRYHYVCQKPDKTPLERAMEKRRCAERMWDWGALGLLTCARDFRAGFRLDMLSHEPVRFTSDEHAWLLHASSSS